MIHDAELEMDDPVAYDMVLEHILHVQRGYDMMGGLAGPGATGERRWHYAIVNSSRSNEVGSHWGLSLWDGQRRPDRITFVDPYAEPHRFMGAKRAAQALGLKVRLIGAGHQTCGWRCGYICLWWALWIGNRGEAPQRGLPGVLPKMQGSFPSLCQSILREGRRDGHGPSKNTEGSIVEVQDGVNGPTSAPIGTDSAASHASGSRADPPGVSSHSEPSGNFVSLDFQAVACEVRPPPKRTIAEANELASIYIPPPPATATPQQLHSMHYPVPPPKRRRLDPTGSTGGVIRQSSEKDNISIYGSTQGLLHPCGDPALEAVNKGPDRSGIG